MMRSLRVATCWSCATLHRRSRSPLPPHKTGKRSWTVLRWTGSKEECICWSSLTLASCSPTTAARTASPTNSQRLFALVTSRSITPTLAAACFFSRLWTCIPPSLLPFAWTGLGAMCYLCCATKLWKRPSKKLDLLRRFPFQARLPLLQQQAWHQPQHPLH